MIGYPEDFSGNPTPSYRSNAPLRILYKVTEWTGHSSEQLKMMHEHLEHLKQHGIAAGDD
ncbi:NAD(+)--rifampin ADP-ribosyltransferase [Oleiharenicola lentus]|uniref:NAD(+)--rifampin ADP-ribosyltransferase n=1 Tax=Oleiharenicola lentus TaxID=2508720 RepID=UPI003F66EA09